MIERIIKAVRLCAKKDAEINADTNLFADLDFDSVDTLMLIGELEAEFNININESDFSDVKTAGDIAMKLEGAGLC